MNNIFFIFIPFILLSMFFTGSSLASSREEMMERTLAKAESEISRQDTQVDWRSTNNIPQDNKEGIKDYGLYLSGGYDANHIHYSEWSAGNKLDENYGKQDGFYVNAGYKSPNYYGAVLGKPFIEGYYRHYDDLIKYKGRTSLGAPFDFNERSALRRFGIKIGSRRDFSKKGEVFAYLDTGKRIWYRGENEVISGVLTYAEKYQWFYSGLGAGINYNLFSKLCVGIDGEWLFAYSSKMRADLYEGGTFKLKNVYGAEVKTPLKYYIIKNLSLDLTPYFTYWHINESDPVVISGASYVEPDSKTHEEGVLAGLTYTF